MSETDLVAMARRLLAVDFDTEKELDAAVAVLEAEFTDPDVVGYIFHWERYFDEQPSTEDVVERASQHRPIEL